MAVLRLELGIDSDVYPELHAKLASLERSELREEKLRELASTGLIWELLRIHGPGIIESMSAAELIGVRLQPDPGIPAAEAAVDAGPVTDHVPHIPENVPVLFDVVDQADMAAPEPVAVSVPTPAEVPHAATETAAAATLAQATVTKARSARMKRMKDSGLFQNG